MKKIKRFNVYQTAKVFALVYFITTAIFLIPFALFFSWMKTSLGFPFGGVFFFILPFIYGFIGFVFTALACVIYNFVSGRFGGIEVEVETVQVPTAPFNDLQPSNG